MSVSVSDHTTSYLETELKAGWRVISMERVGVATGISTGVNVKEIVMVLLERTTVTRGEAY